MNGPADIHVTGSRDVFEAESCAVDHGAVHATGRWRVRWGPGNRHIRYGECVSRTWPVAAVEIHWGADVRVAA